MLVSEYDVVLGDVLRIALPAGAILRAGSANQRQIINWVVILTRPDEVAAQTEMGDLVLLPAEVQAEQSTAVLSRLLQQLAELRVAAVIIFAPLPEEVIEALTGADMALVEVSADASLRQIHKNIATLLTDRQRQISERGMYLYRQLSEMSREGQGLDRMADLLASLTGKIIVIQDKRLEIVALSTPPDSITLDADRLTQAVRDPENLPPLLRNRKAAAKANKSHWQLLLFPGDNVARLVSPIISGDRARGYLSIVGAADDLDVLDTVAVEQGAAACALEMARAKAVSEAKKALRGDFLEGVLAGKMPPDEIDRLATRLDHDTQQPHVILALKWLGNNAPSLRGIETTANWLLSSNKRPALVHIYGGDHVCIFHTVRGRDDMDYVREMARRLREQLQAEYPDQALAAGLSGPVMTLAEWPTGHRQALQALEVGQRLHLGELVDYNNLGVYRLLSQLDHVPVVHEFCDQVIGALVNYDRQHHSSLVQTLDAYFRHHGNISQTAEDLFIHRNTLLYRLERIQEMTGHSLNAADMRLALHLALKLWLLRPETEVRRLDRGGSLVESA